MGVKGRARASSGRTLGEAAESIAFILRAERILTMM